MTQVQANTILTANNAADAKEVKLVNKFNELSGKLDEAYKALEAHRAGAATEAARLNIVEGTEVGFNFGRGETRKAMAGKVVATVDTPQGRLLKVMAGEGVDMKLYDVRAKDAILPGDEVHNVEPKTAQAETDAVAEGATGNDFAEAEHDAAQAAVAQL